MEDYTREVLEGLREAYKGIYDKSYLTDEYCPELSFRFKNGSKRDGYVSVRAISGRKFYVSIQAGDDNESGLYTTVYGIDSSLLTVDRIRRIIGRTLVFVDTLG